MRLKYVYPDTNILLHFAALDGLDWRGLCDADVVVVRIAQPVISELNAKKDTGRTRAIRNRAQTVIRRLKNQVHNFGVEAELTPGVKLFLESSTHAVSLDAGLNPQVSDDVLIAQVLAFKKETQEEVILITDDDGVGLMVKAKHWGIAFLEPPEAMRLPPEPDPEQKERDELRRKVALLEGARPELKLRFFGGTTTIHLERPSIDLEASVNAEVMEIRKQYPPLPLPESPAAPKTAPIGFGKMSLDEIMKSPSAIAYFSEVPWQQDSQLIQNYNGQLQAFISQSEAVIRKNAHMAARTVIVQMEIENSGSAPATDLRIKMHFPDGFELLEEKDLEECLEEMPEPPIHPGNRNRAWNLDDYRFPVASLPSIKDLKIHGPHLSIEKTNSYNLRWELLKLQQGEHYSIGPMALIFEAAPFSFAITCEVVADNVPEIVRGELSVVA